MSFLSKVFRAIPIAPPSLFFHICIGTVREDPIQPEQKVRNSHIKTLRTKRPAKLPSTIPTDLLPTLALKKSIYINSAEVNPHGLCTGWKILQNPLFVQIMMVNVKRSMSVNKVCHSNFAYNSPKTSSEIVIWFTIQTRLIWFDFFQKMSV